MKCFQCLNIQGVQIDCLLNEEPEAKTAPQETNQHLGGLTVPGRLEEAPRELIVHFDHLFVGRSAEKLVNRFLHRPQGLRLLGCYPPDGRITDRISNTERLSGFPSIRCGLRGVRIPVNPATHSDLSRPANPAIPATPRSEATLAC